MPTPPDPSTAPDRRPRRSRVALIALAATVAAAATTAWLLSTGPRPDTDTAVQAPPAMPRASTAAAPPAIAGLNWQTVNGVTLPFGAAGPANPDGTGYTDTAAGAVLAGWQLSVRLLTAPDAEFEARLSQVRATPDAQAALRTDVTAIDALTPDQFHAVIAAPVAYRIVKSPSDAGFFALYYAVPYPGGGYALLDRAVVWTGSDWQMLWPSTLPELSVATTLPGGYTPLPPQ